MSTRRHLGFLVCAAALLCLDSTAAAAPGGATGNWTLALADSVTVAPGAVVLADLATAELPSTVADVVVLAGGEPGTRRVVDRGLVLRKLVAAGLADGVLMRGAAACLVAFRGGELEETEVSRLVRERLDPWLPARRPGGPDSWLEIELPDLTTRVEQGWSLALVDPRELAPGRNLVPVEIGDGSRRTRFTATVKLHVYAEAARCGQPIGRDSAVRAEMFVWEWRDQAAGDPDLVFDRAAVAGRSATRDLETGALLRRRDLTPTPLVRSGDAVELVLRRGGVAVKARGTARQSGRLDQMISVRNEMTGKLVTARVVGARLVEWSR